ncbi:S1 family peptidase [Kribbella sp. NPDC058245]|uniref:S1 family peptidase n=1 Tax=Kribbella sp. NPDC058245 TaxID=3346399 RepID=UPI0036E5F4A3
MPDDSAVQEPGSVALINASAPLDDLFGAQFCGGTLIRPNVVLTAAHCIEGRPVSRIEVVVGGNNLCRTAAIAGERIAIESFHIAKPASLDAGILILKSPSTVPPVRLGDISDSPQDALTAVGWGRIDQAEPAPCRKHGVPLRPADAAKCQLAEAAAPELKSDDQLCAIPEKVATRNTCSGDSGGPVFQTTDKQLRLVAITNWGDGCKLDGVGFYTRTSALSTWIDALVSATGR